MSAAATGTAHHKFLQHVALEKADDLAALKREARRLETAGVLTADECAALDLEAVAAFWKSEPGRKIRAQKPDCLKRELPFTAKFSPAELDAIIGAKTPPGLEDEFVVVQGVADLVVLLPEEIWLVDFKTDEIKSEGIGGAKAALRTAVEALRGGVVANLFAAGHKLLAAFSHRAKNVTFNGRETARRPQNSIRRRRAEVRLLHFPWPATSIEAEGEDGGAAGAPASRRRTTAGRKSFP